MLLVELTKYNIPFYTLQCQRCAARLSARYSEETIVGTRCGSSVELLWCVSFLSDCHHDHRLWQHHAQLGLGQAGDHSVCDHWNATLSALSIQYRYEYLVYIYLVESKMTYITIFRRCAGKIIQVDLLQGLPLSHLSRRSQAAHNTRTTKIAATGKSGRFPFVSCCPEKNLTTSFFPLTVANA